MRKLTIDGKIIDDKSNSYVIAEIGHNHQGDLETAKEMFRVAKESGADAVIVSGSRSPDPPSFERVKAVHGAVSAPVLIGSGVSLANVADYFAASDGVLIGETDFKVDGTWGGRSDGDAYAEAVRRCRG